LRQLIANQMFGLQVYQMLAAGVFIESTLCSEVASLFSSLFNGRRKRGLLDGFLVLLALQDLVDAYRDSRSAATMEQDKNNIKLWPEVAPAPRSHCLRPGENTTFLIGHFPGGG